MVGAQYGIRGISKCFSKVPLCILRFQWIHQISSPPNPKISEIVNQISSLTLKETADLISELKIRLNIQDVRPIITSIATSEPGLVQKEQEEEKDQKLLFNVKLESYDSTAKAKIIKEVKSLLGLNLVEAKKFVESSPKIIKEAMNKEDAEKMKKTLEDLGAKIVLE